MEDLYLIGCHGGWTGGDDTVPVLALVATRAVTCLGQDGQVRHVADAGQGLAPEPVGCDAAQVFEFSQFTGCESFSNYF